MIFSGEIKMEKRNVIAIMISALLCFLLTSTGKLKDRIEEINAAHIIQTRSTKWES